MPAKWLTLLFVMTGSLAACGSSGVARHGLGAEGNEAAFAPTSAEWRMFNPTIVTFRHAEDDMARNQDKRTYVDAAGVAAFNAVFGNVLLDGHDPHVAGLTSEPATAPPLPTLTIRGSLVRLSAATELVSQVRDDLQIDAGGGSTRGAVLEVLLVPRAEQVTSYMGGLSNGLRTNWESGRTLRPGCQLARFRDPAGRRDVMVLVIHTPDGALSWSDGADRQCMTAFFAEAFGVPSQAMSALLPPDGSAECTFARIVPEDKRNSNYPQLTYQSGCPQAPIRRAASLKWYAGQEATSTSRDSTSLVRTIRSNCEIMRARGNPQDLSC